MSSNNHHGEIPQMFERAHRILIVSHIRPDGDAIGSTLGLGLALQAAGKDVQMVMVDGVPSSFRHLPGSEQISRKKTGEHDLTIVVDCSDLQRTGEVLNGKAPDLNIDHHITNLNFAAVNLVNPSAVATSSILAEYLPKWGLPVTQAVAEALLTGIVSDTLGFRTTNVTASALRQSADLMDHGANLSELYHQALVRRSYAAARYWGRGLERLQREGRLVWTALTLEDRVAVGYPGNDDADLVNIISTIDESDVSVIFVEQKGGRVKVSWRAEPGWDVSSIALDFGGGGHAAAAGADIVGSLDTVTERVLLATRKFMDGNVVSEKNEGTSIV